MEAGGRGDVRVDVWPESCYLYTVDWPLPTMRDSGDGVVSCTFSNIPVTSSWNCQKLAAEQLLVRGRHAVWFDMAGGMARPSQYKSGLLHPSPLPLWTCLTVGQTFFVNRIVIEWVYTTLHINQPILWKLSVKNTCPILLCETLWTEAMKSKHEMSFDVHMTDQLSLLWSILHGALFAWFCNDQLCCMQQMRASAVQMRTLISAFYTEDLKVFSYLELRVRRILCTITAQIFIFTVIH